MKSTYTSILLFIILFAIIFYLDNDFISLCDEIITRCESIEIHLKNNTKDIAYTESVDLLEYIKSESDIPAVYLSHIDFDSLLNESLKLSLYIEKQDDSEAFASVHILRYNAEHLKELQKPTIKNIL